MPLKQHLARKYAKRDPAYLEVSLPDDLMSDYLKRGPIEPRMPQPRVDMKEASYFDAVLGRK